MNRVFLWCLTGMLSLPLALQAQVPPQTPALVDFPTGDAAWTVDITYQQSPATPGTNPTGAEGKPAPQTPPPEEDASQKPKMKKVDVLRKGDIRRNTITWADGKTTERWRLDPLKVNVVENEENGGIFIVPDGDSLAAFISAIHFDSSSFEWLKPDMLQGDKPVTYLGKQCLHYKGMMPQVAVAVGGSGSGKISLPPVQTEVWVDAITLLPVAYSHSATLFAFHFGQVPAEPLVLPEKFDKIVKRYQSHMTPPKRLDLQ